MTIPRRSRVSTTSSSNVAIYSSPGIHQPLPPHGCVAPLGFIARFGICSSGASQVWLYSTLLPPPHLQRNSSRWWPSPRLHLFLVKNLLVWLCNATLEVIIWVSILYKLSDHRFRFFVACSKVGHFIYGQRDQVWPDFVCHFTIFRGIHPAKSGF